MNTIYRSALACMAAVALQGCGTTYPQLLGQRYFVTNLDTYPVLISTVDGRSPGVVPAQVEPGMRRIVVQGTPGGAGFSALETFMLDVKHCMRYYIVAVKVNRLDTNFTPKIDYEEPLAGCIAPAAS